VQLTNQQKLDILNELNKKVSTITAIFDKYGVHRNTVGQWKKDRDNIRKEVERRDGRIRRKQLQTMA
jgi:hypothetical protein